MKNNTIQMMVIACLFLSVKMVSQNVIWSKVLAGQQEEYGNAITLDANSNVIIAGSFRDICYGGNFALFSSGNTDAFVQKISPAGAVLWTNQYGNGNADNAHSVAADSAGNIFVAGTFTGTVFFGAGSLNSTVTDSSFFVIKLNPDGGVLWRKAIPGYSAHRPKLTVDVNDNLFLTGVFDGDRNFDSFNIDSDDGLGYVAKISTSNGSVVWVTQFGSGTTLNGTPVVVNITTSNFATDNFGNIYVTGCFRGHGRFGSQNVLIANSDANSYIMKINSAGTILWTKFATGATEGTSIVVDSNNNIYTAGNYKGQVNINNTVYSAPPNYYSIYLEKLDADGGLLWFKNYDVNTPAHYDAHPQLAIDDSANLFLKCLFANTINFENNVFTGIVSTNPNVLKPQLLASFNSDGDNLWVNQFENPNDNIYYGIYADKETNIAVDHTGLYFTSGSTKFNNVSYSAESGANVFTAKLTLPYVLGNKTFENENADVSVAPIPTKGKVDIDFFGHSSNVEITVLNSAGQHVNTERYDKIMSVSMEMPNAPGIYFLVIKSDDTHVVKKVIKY